MKAHNYPVGTVLSFKYDKQGTERLARGPIKRVVECKGGWLIVIECQFRKAERRFWEHKMSDVEAELASGLVGWQVVACLPDGSERVAVIAAERHRAESYANGFNALTEVTGRRAELRSFPVPCLARAS